MAAVRGGRLASAVVVSVLALGALWLACGFRIARAVDHCAAVKAAGGSMWGDAECRDSIKVMTPMAVLSLILMAVAVRLEVKAELAEEADAQICEAAASAHDVVLPDPELQQPVITPAGPGPGPERLIVCAYDAVVVLMIISLSLYYISVILMGKLLQMVGASILEDYPGDEGIAAVMVAGSIFKNIGYLSLSVWHFCLVVPYAVLRLRRFLKKVVSLIESA
ncbi:hypothetical protein E2562_013351 [Oryza meyeriana var. granulata]|uniref:Uncharacterized protein n=1 Tax=Oryza meyeriana var. granulata TaxID=110450 RepID=A0A6G1CG35_9ORYZ|nr:hypothetical protein E2562_013351 [Oryza meyeriana var. granulata]